MYHFFRRKSTGWNSVFILSVLALRFQLLLELEQKPVNTRHFTHGGNPSRPLPEPRKAGASVRFAGQRLLHRFRSDGQHISLQ